MQWEEIHSQALEILTMQRIQLQSSFVQITENKSKWRLNYHAPKTKYRRLEAAFEENGIKRDASLGLRFVIDSFLLFTLNIYYGNRNIPFESVAVLSNKISNESKTNESSGLSNPGF